MITKDPVQDAKKTLRRQILKVRDALTEEERVQASNRLKEHILGHPWYIESEVLLGFVSYGSEIDTGEILRAALGAGKQVFVPKIIKNDKTGKKEMQFYRIRALEELQVGFKGIKEPSGDSASFLYQEASVDRTLMLMPGVAFDQERDRMGYGGGFYDIFLADKADLTSRTIAVGFACQMVEHVPTEGQDVKPCQIICL